jgi:glycosyltransferase involved in cell wall biosynthesis
MKILVVQDRLRSGGTERQSILLSRAFAAEGHAAALLTFRPGGALEASAAGIARHSLQPVDLGLDWFAPGLTGAVKKFRPDIVLCMGRMANGYAGFLQGRADGAWKVVGTMRTGKPLPWLMRRSFRKVSHVVANSAETRGRLVAGIGLPPERITVIRNALVFPPLPALRDEALRARFGAGPGTSVLLCVAMFRSEKGQHELLKIAAGLPAAIEWHLWFAGEGPTRAACARLAGRLGLGDRIRFLGFEADPRRLYAAADVAVHASASESLSNFLAEAQAAGLPTVAYEVQGISECLVPGRTGWVIARGDRAAFRLALERLAAEPAEARARRSAEARAFARETFAPERQVAKYLELFGRLASGGIVERGRV